MPSARIERATLIVLVVLSLILLAMVIYPFASALFVAAVLAAALVPCTERLAARLRGRRQLAAGVVTLGVLLLLVVPIAAVTLSLGKEAVAGIGYIKETMSGEGVAGLINDLPAPLRTLVEKVLEQIPGGEERIQQLTDTQGGRAWSRRRSSSSGGTPAARCSSPPGRCWRWACPTTSSSRT